MQLVVITSFSGEYDFLSNFHPNQPDSHVTVEHLFQAEKATGQSDYDFIMSSETPSLAKKRGRMITLRKDWESVKYELMYKCLVRKFKNADMRERIIFTGCAYLEEGNSWHDNEWGACSCERCFNLSKRNMLGLLLMRVRRDIRENRI